MPFASKWDLLPEPLRLEIIAYARANGSPDAIRKYWVQSGLSRDGLRYKLSNILHPKSEVSKKVEKALSETKLSKKEKEILKKIRSGEISGIEEINKYVVSTIYEKMLKNPYDVKFIDFFRTQLLELKKQEQTEKNNIMQDLINRMFSGKLPPTICPHCNKPLYEPVSLPKNVIEGEVLDE